MPEEERYGRPLFPSVLPQDELGIAYEIGTLSKVLAPFDRYVPSGERNFVNADKDGTFKAVAERYRDAEIDYLDGVTVQYADWWFNIRASNTEPLLRLNAEAETAELLNAKLAELTPMLGEPAEEH
ncbi:MAG: hypothetical protein D6744_08650 [Planctomycetota bacterium]|nr:MAG: hypothetical protein D6744_08650 [Planctomycetota bacterium]